MYECAYEIFEVRSFTRSWDTRGIRKIGAVPGYAHAPFSPKFSIGFCSDGLCECTPAKFEVRRFTHSWDNSDWSFGGCEPQFRGREGRRGSGMVPFERALVSSYRPSIVTFPLSARFAAVVLQHATLSHPTSSLPKISLCSPGLRVTKSEVVGLIVRVISFQYFQPMWSWSTNVTDRQTNGRHAISAPRTIVHRAVKMAAKTSRPNSSSSSITV